MTTAVRSCAATSCSFNHDGCNALAITIAGAEAQPTCGTFVQLDARRPMTGEASSVGACHRMECSYNSDLVCTAEGIEVTDTANCATYTVS
ncbi:DUF1540 domain-containing protein [Citricoccus sp. SGAir0253]|uniref:DUF1540 domain-containing protein n=1 Tax=Citricoccus sp. SGAir0253 TaxID=2567881 RepID=UPI0010CD099C|nr:DUF1540 domain-containing protein [Citricoccus sp. SGAir0253]QCU79233.1 DUF1540 domain-containing protein [Citricoccus sp. SGAir0253]